MARLLREPQKLKVSKAEAAGKAHTKLKLNGSLGVIDAAAYLGIHKYTLREFIGKGFVDVIMVGARPYLDEDELLRLKGLLREHGSLAKAMKYYQDNKDNFLD